MPRYELHPGDCREALARMPAGSIQACVTSPPYYNLRAYGTHPQVWDGAFDCAHEWSEQPPARACWGDPDTLSAKQSSNRGSRSNVTAIVQSRGEYCWPCGAWRGELGAEPDPRMYVRHLVDLLAGVHRVLRDDGLLFLNIGDSYVANRGRQVADSKHRDVGNGRGSRVPPGLKSKDLMGVPWRTAFALQEAGWYLRADCIWHKPNAMCESITDRPTKSHEYVFILAKSERYFWDRLGCLEPYAEKTLTQKGTRYRGKAQKAYAGVGAQDPSDAKRRIIASMEKYGGRNMRSVWSITARGFLARKYGIEGADHFASFPKALAEKCLAPAISRKGACSTCGTPWERLVDHRPMVIDRSARTHGKGRTRASGTMVAPAESAQFGWTPGCRCYNHAPRPCRVLDPFAGTGTVGEVALEMGAFPVLCELSEDYQKIIRARLGEP